MKVFQKNSNIFNLLSEGVSEGIIVVNDQQIIVGTNSSTNEMFGYEKDELVGKTLNVLIPSKYHHKHSNHFENFLSKSEKRRMARGKDLYGVRKNGEEFPVEAGLNPFQLYGGNYIMALVIDISERKRAEQESSHWEKIFNESLNEIFIFCAKSLRFVNANMGATRNIGYSSEELKLLTPVDLKPDYTEKMFRKVIAPLLENKKQKIEFETVHQRKDGSQYAVEVHLQLSTIGNKKVFVAIILDVTDRKNYTEKLEKTVAERTKQLRSALAKEKELNELKTKFLSLVSHEFKTPLSSILTSTTLLTKYTTTDQQEKRNKHLATIKNKVKYLDNILTDFLSVERLDSGKVNYKFTTFPLSKLINQVVYDCNMLIKSGQRILYPENMENIVLTFDEKILELALSNLVHNAIKYAPENTMIEISGTIKNKRLLLGVTDHGMGIPEEEQRFIFNRYFRAANALLTQGTGIGLNIAKGHLENLGASISFNSVLNEGTTFLLDIPTDHNQNSHS